MRITSVLPVVGLICLTLNLAIARGDIIITPPPTTIVDMGDVDITFLVTNTGPATLEHYSFGVGTQRISGILSVRFVSADFPLSIDPGETRKYILKMRVLPPPIPIEVYGATRVTFNPTLTEVGSGNRFTAEASVILRKPEASAVPEPSGFVLALVGCGGLGLLGLRRRGPAG